MTINLYANNRPISGSISGSIPRMPAWQMIEIVHSMGRRHGRTPIITIISRDGTRRRI